MPGHDFRLTTPEGLLPTVYGMIFPCWDNISTETINMSADVSVSITERYSHGQFEFVEVGYAKATDATIRYELEFKPYTKERDGLMPSSHVFITIRMGEVVLFNGWPEELSEACANIKLMGQIPEIL